MLATACLKRRWIVLSLAGGCALALLLLQTNTFYRSLFNKSRRTNPRNETMRMQSKQAAERIIAAKLAAHKKHRKPMGSGFHWVSSPPTDIPTTKKPGKCAGSACVVPRIVHLIWFAPDDSEFKFVYCVSILSIQRFIQPRRILFWHDEEPTGTWWKFVRMHVPNVELLRRHPPSRVFGNKVSLPEHQADVARLQILLTYGGIYLDLDTIVLKSFEKLMTYDVAMGAESPELLGNGIIVARPNATFIRTWYEHYNTFDDRAYNEHSVRLPMTLAHQYPELVHIEWEHLLRPNWFERQWLIGNGKLWDWFNNYAVHLYLKYHKLEYSPQNIKFLNTTTGELLRYIYYGTYEVFKVRPKKQQLT